MPTLSYTLEISIHHTLRGDWGLGKIFLKKFAKSLYTLNTSLIYDISRQCPA